jgi:hypothetical protein
MVSPVCLFPFAALFYRHKAENLAVGAFAVFAVVASLSKGTDLSHEFGTG